MTPMANLIIGENKAMGSMISKHNNLPYGSHVLVLLPCLQLTDGPVLELGGGIYSTSLLSLYSQSRFCRTIETNMFWYEKIRSFFPLSPDITDRRGHEILHAKDYENALISDRCWEIALVDQEASCRVKSIKRLKDCCRIMIIHDTERPSLDEVMQDFRYKLDVRKVLPNTSIVSDTDDLHWLKEQLLYIL